jgi:hypothetical protein
MTTMEMMHQDHPKAQVADKASVGLKAKTDALVAAFKLHPEIDVGEDYHTPYAFTWSPPRRLQ